MSLTDDALIPRIYHAKLNVTSPLVLQMARGVGVIPEMQLAVSSVMGRTADNGVSGFFIGTALHFLVSVIPAIIYAFEVARLPMLNRMP